MRRETFRMTPSDALAMLRAAPFMHLAGTDDGGHPVLRAVNVVHLPDAEGTGALAFHGAPAGEKMAMIGRPVVLSCEELVAEVPSTFLGDDEACAASVLYRSVQVHGVLERVDDERDKAAALQRLMERFQPEGGHAPIAADHPRYQALYQAAVRGLLIARVPLADVDGKAKLAQNRTPAEVSTLVDKLWQRGRPGDARAVDLILEANPSAMRPAFLAAPAGAALRCALDERALPEAVLLLAGAYWNEGVPRGRIEGALRGASAWVGAHDGAGALVGCARAISDGARWASLFDVMVRPDWRGRGLGQALVRLILDHPAVRGARRVMLRTRDARGLYARFGFAERTTTPYLEMMLDRGG